jgi:ABC-type branched-subunit amino acid transport system ATPase component
LRFGASGAISRWWSLPGFKEWFRNADEFRQRLEYLANLSLDALEYVLVDPKAQSSAKVNAAKLLMEVARKMPSKVAQERFLDEAIAGMSAKQLEEFVQKKSQQLLPTAPPTNSVDRIPE